MSVPFIFCNFFSNVRGTYDFTRVMILIQLTKYYCRLCHRDRLIQIHHALRAILPIIASTKVPSYIENETMLKEVTDSNIEDCRCSCLGKLSLTNIPLFKHQKFDSMKN